MISDGHVVQGSTLGCDRNVETWIETGVFAVVVWTVCG